MWGEQMRTVLEALLECNKEKLLDIYMDKYAVSTSPEAARREREDTADWLTKISMTTPVEDEEPLIISPTMAIDAPIFEEDKGGEWLDCVGYTKKDIEDFNFNFSEIDNLEESDFDDATQEQCDRIMEKLKGVPSGYAFEMTDWANILAYKVSDTSIKQYGLEEVMAGIMNEMLFFGYDESHMQEEREELARRAEEVENYSSLPEEERNKYFKSWEEVKTELGFEETRTEEERAIDLLNMWRSSCKSRLRMVRLFRELKKELEEKG